MTQECSVLLLILPLIAVAGVVSTVRKFRLSRVAVALLAALVVMVAANQVRIQLIGQFIRWFGFSHGYPIAHTFIGSVIALVGFAAGIALFVRIATSGRRTGDPTP